PGDLALSRGKRCTAPNARSARSVPIRFISPALYNVNSWLETQDFLMAKQISPLTLRLCFAASSDIALISSGEARKTNFSHDRRSLIVFLRASVKACKA